MKSYGRGAPPAWSAVVRCSVVATVLIAAVGMLQGIAFGEATQNAAAAKGESLQHLLLNGGPIMWPLGFCSIVVLAYAVERFINLRSKCVAPPTVIQHVEQSIENGETSAAIKSLDDDPSMAARVLRAGLKHRGLPAKEIEQAMEDVGRREVSRLRDNILPLNVVANIAPLLGLLGTVFGMIEAFQSIAGSAGLGRPERLANGIYRALVTTAVGLTIAIPSLALYYYFNGRVIRLLRRIDDVAGRLVDRFRRDAPSTEEAPA